MKIAVISDLHGNLPMLKAALKEIEKEGLFTRLEKGNFGNVKRPKTGGKGLQGVAEKGGHYFNPFIERMKR